MQYLVLILTIIAVIIIAKIFAWPLKKIIKLVVNIAIGLVMILIVNVFGEGIGLHIPFNIITAIIAGSLGIPGVLALIVINYIF
ncbi:MAG: pro-sigmaK processing inhibitor BofA family protein [Clostridia bacterium]|nr:pro-sigmaK processing inhibitor BofA family protein [Clostridia bacterium]